MAIRFTLLFILLFALAEAPAQELLKPRPSPLAIAAIRYKDNYVKITYCQPQRKGRKVFGGIVPFGQIWRTGANETTELTTTRDIEIHGQVLRAGTYSLFTIPGPEEWTFIINSDVGMWGAYNYNRQKDVYRFPVPIEKTDKVYDAFTIEFDHRNQVADLILVWDTTRISIPIRFLN